MEIKVPKNIDLSVDGKKITVRGPKGAVERDFDSPVYNRLIKIEKKDGAVGFTTEDQRKKTYAVMKTWASHIKNAITGVTNNYKFELKIVYRHFPITVNVKDKEIRVKNFLGEKGIRSCRIIGDTQVKIDKDIIIVTSPDVEAAGQTAANIENACRISGKDRRIFIDGIFITEKNIVGSDD